MIPDLQQSTTLATSTFILLRPRPFSCAIFEETDITDEKEQTRGRGYFRLLNRRFIKQLKCWKQCFALFLVVSAKFIKECFEVSVEDIFGKGGRLVVVLNEHLNGLHHEESVLLRLNIRYTVIIVSGKKLLCQSWVSGSIHKRRKQSLVFVYVVTNFKPMCVVRSKTGRQKLRRHHFVHNVRFAYIDEAQAKVFLARSCVAQQALHSFCERCFPLQNHGENVRIFYQFYWGS